MLWVAACHSMPAAEEDAGAAVLRIPVTVEGRDGPVTFQAEMADTPEAGSRGLLFRERLGEREAMLFLFPSEAQQSFWMRNTFIPLDMIFIRADRSSLGIVENAEPRNDARRQVPGLSQFVLEINGGLSARRGFGNDQPVTFVARCPRADRLRSWRRG